MAAVGVDWTIGREGRAEFGESLAGKQYPKKKMNINGFDGEGKLLPLVTTANAGPEEAADKNVMTYSFRLCLTADPNNRVPMPKPDNYDPGSIRDRSAIPQGERQQRWHRPLPPARQQARRQQLDRQAVLDRFSRRWQRLAFGRRSGTEEDLGSAQAVHA